MNNVLFFKFYDIIYINKTIKYKWGGTMGQKLKKNKIKIILSIILTIILIIIIRNLLVKKYNEIFVQKYVSKIYPNYTIVEKNYEYLDGFLVNLV